MLSLLVCAWSAVDLNQLPSPDLSAAEVVRVQLQALQANPSTQEDAGIRLAFRFASPANRSVTGPVQRFIPMVKSQAYAPLLGHERASVRPMDAGPNRARFIVEVQRGTTLHAFLWEVSKQEENPVEGCWMTDAVTPVEVESDSRPATIAT
jgi:hypothetical protein